VRDFPRRKSKPLESTKEKTYTSNSTRSVENASGDATFSQLIQLAKTCKAGANYDGLEKSLVAALVAVYVAINAVDLSGLLGHAVSVKVMRSLNRARVAGWEDEP
jgi:hypothetical protein